jgi:hypothetical protein
MPDLVTALPARRSSNARFGMMAAAAPRYGPSWSLTSRNERTRRLLTSVVDKRALKLYYAGMLRGVPAFPLYASFIRSDRAGHSACARRPALSGPPRPYRAGRAAEGFPDGLNFTDVISPQPFRWWLPPQILPRYRGRNALPPAPMLGYSRRVPPVRRVAVSVQ